MMTYLKGKKRKELIKTQAKKDQVRTRIADVTEYLPDLFADKTIKAERIDSLGFKHFKEVIIRELLNPITLNCTVLQVLAKKDKSLQINSKHFVKQLHCIEGKVKIKQPKAYARILVDGEVLTIPPDTDYTLAFKANTLLIVTIHPRIQLTSHKASD